MSYDTKDELEKDLVFSFSTLPTFRGNTHWQYLQLNAHHVSQKDPIGYLRVAFVTKEVGEAMNHERLLFVQTQGNSVYGHSSLVGEEENIYTNARLWDSWKKKPRLAARMVMETVMRVSYSQWNNNLKSMSEGDLIKWVEDHRPHLNEYTQSDLEQMFHFAVNKADVDYISLEDKWLGKGIALSMYQSMASFLDEQLGMTLNASTTQSSSATKCWERLKKQGLITQASDGRMFFTGGISQETLNNRSIVPSPLPHPTTKRRFKKKP